MGLLEHFNDLYYSEIERTGNAPKEFLISRNNYEKLLMELNLQFSNGHVVNTSLLFGVSLRIIDDDRLTEDEFIFDPSLFIFEIKGSDIKGG